MPRGLRRYQESGQSHFVTFSCYRRQVRFTSAAIYDDRELKESAGPPPIFLRPG